MGPPGILANPPVSKVGPGDGRGGSAGWLFQGAVYSPPPREPLKFRSGEQILHIDSAPTPSAGRLFQGAVCSPLLANPCGFVPGSKFFTQFPRRKPVPGGPEHAPPRVGAQKSTLPIYRQGASLSPTVPPRACTVSCRSPAGQYSPPQVPVPRGTFN